MIQILLSDSQLRKTCNIVKILLALLSDCLWVFLQERSALSSLLYVFLFSLLFCVTWFVIPSGTFFHIHQVIAGEIASEDLIFAFAVQFP